MIHYGSKRIAIYDDRHPGHGRLEVAVDRRLSVRERAGPHGELYVLDGPDPRILLADELLHTLVWKPELVHPGITLEWQPLDPCPPAGCCQRRGYLALRGNNCYYGALLTFDTQQGRIVYRIDVFDLEVNAWWAQWPD